MSRKTKYTQIQAQLPKLRLALLDDMAKLRHSVQEAMERNDTHAVLELWPRIDSVLERLEEFVRTSMAERAEAYNKMTEQTHTIRMRSNRRIVVTEDCINQVWNEVERLDGRGKATVVRGKMDVDRGPLEKVRISSIRLLEDLQNEVNSGVDRITDLTVEVEDTNRTCKVTWTTHPTMHSGTEIHVFESGPAARERADRLDAILRMYETETEFGSWMRGFIKVAIIIGVGILVTELASNFGRRLFEGEGVSALIGGASGVCAMWISFQVGRIVDRRVELAIGRGKRRVEFNEWCRKSVLILALTTLLAILTSHIS